MNKKKVYKTLEVLCIIMFSFNLVDSIMYFYNLYTCSFDKFTMLYEVLNFVKDFMISIFMTFFWYKISSLFKILKNEQKSKTE